MNELNYIRDLAKRQAEIAALPIMKERKQKWYDINDGKTSSPIVCVEWNGLQDEIFPPLKCENPLYRKIESQLMSTIIIYDLTIKSLSNKFSSEIIVKLN